MLGHLIFGRSALMRGGRSGSHCRCPSNGNSKAEVAAFARCLARGRRFIAPISVAA